MFRFETVGPSYDSLRVEELSLEGSVFISYIV